MINDFNHAGSTGTKAIREWDVYKLPPQFCCGHSIQPVEPKGAAVTVNDKIILIWKESCRGRDSKRWDIPDVPGASSFKFNCPRYDFSQYHLDTHILNHSKGEP